MRVIYKGSAPTVQMMHGVLLNPGENEVEDDAGQAMLKSGLVVLPKNTEKADKAATLSIKSGSE